MLPSLPARYVPSLTSPSGGNGVRSRTKLWTRLGRHPARGAIRID